MPNSLWPCRLYLTKLLCPWDSPGKNTEVGWHTLLQEIFPTQGLNLPLLCHLHWQSCSFPQALPGKSHTYKYVNIKHTDTHETVCLMLCNVYDAMLKEICVDTIYKPDIIYRIK